MAMFALTSQAAYYLVGEAPFGNGWDPSNGLEMTLNSDGLYSVKGTVNGTIYFVLADNLAAAGDWTTFNNEYRIGPLGANEEVTVGSWITTQKAAGNGNGSYKFTGTGSEYVITYNPYISKFKIEGYVAPIVIDTYTVAGTPASVFGTEWDPSNETNNMLKLDDGTYTLTKYGCQLAGDELKFKVVGNHDWGFAWPDDNYVVTVDESGFYDVTINFNPETKEITVETVQAGTFDPTTGELYVLGDVNDNGGWDPSKGFKMDTEDGNIFTAQITTTGNNIDENDGVNYSYFQFTTKLGENSEDWSGISAYRIGAIENDYLLAEDLYGVEIGLGNFGTANSFKIADGTYDLTVNLENKTLVVNPAGSGPVEESYQLKKVWEVNDLTSIMATTNDVRQGFGMNSKFYINDKANQTILVLGKNGLTDTTYPGGANCGLTRDEAGNLVVSNATFPGSWTEATIKVINPQTGEMKEYTVPEECGLLGRCDFIGFAKGNLMENGSLYLTGGNTNDENNPFTTGVAILTITDGEVNTDESYNAACDGLTGQTSTVINYYKDLNGEDAMVYAYRSGNPSKLTFDGDNLIATPIILPGKGHANGIFPFIWDGKEFFIYPIMPDYQNGFAIAESGAEAPIIEVASTVAGNANTFQGDWLNAEVDEDGAGVTIYQYYPGGSIAAYRLTKGTGAVDEIADVDKVVAGVRYYNIMGQEMKEINGLTIVVTTYTDGSHSAVKVIK